MDTGKVERVRKIVVLRAGAIGDFLVTLPALQALKLAYPEAELILLGNPWQQEYLTPGRTPVDRVLVPPPHPGIRDVLGYTVAPAEEAHFIADLRAEQLDLAISFQGQGKSANPFLRSLGARITVGSRGQGAAPLDRWLPYYYYQSEVVRYLEIVGLVGARVYDLEPCVQVFTTDLMESQRVVTPTQPYAVLHPGATDLRRRWPTAGFIDVGKALQERGLQVVVTGAGDEQPIVDAVINGLGKGAINACNKLTLGGLTGLLAQSQLVVSNDTGPLHLARAVGAKTVGIYWLPNLLNWGPLTRLRHRPCIAMDLVCPHCGTRPVDPWPFEPHLPSCAHEVSFVRNVTVADVLREVDTLLAADE
jgi:ADP-heptose:LPS heptosyltransferase